MANEQNLIPFTSNQSREEAKRNGAKGGKKSGEIRRKKRDMKDMLSMLLSMELPEDSKAVEQLKSIGIEDEDMNVQTQILMSQVLKAMSGNLDSARFIKDVLNETKSEEDTTPTGDVIEEIDEYINKRFDKR